MPQHNNNYVVIKAGGDVMANKKKWIIGCASLVVLTSLIVVYASMTSSGGAEVDASDGTKQIVFDDVKENDWFYDDVQYVKENGLMTGTDENSFSPNGVTTRGMIVTVLWRNEGSPKANYDGFDDVKSDKYYYQAVSWAYDNEIVSGYDSKTFGAEDDITREQLATIMFRYANFKNYDTTNKEALSKFNDSNKVSDYAVSAFEWALANRIITGTSETTLEPQGNALRSQVAAILRRFSEIYNNAKSTPIKNNQTVNDSSNNGRNSNTGKNTNDHSIIGNHDETDDELDIPHVTIEEVSASPGDDVKIIANIHNNPGILGMTVNINYDMNNLILEKVENGEVFKNVLEMTTSKTLFSGAKIVWDGVEIKAEDIKDGAFLIMYFRIPENAEKGEYQISLNCMTGDIVDNNLTSIRMPFEMGKIIVK